MAGSSSAPALVATFVFGLVVLAASAAIFFFVKASKSPLIRAELRLALSFFLAASTLWGIFDLASTLVRDNSAPACQTVISFAAVFDQVARVSAEQFLLWAVNGGIKVTKLSLAMQGALLVRFILGAIFVGVQRPQFEPVCVASNLVLPIGVIVMVTDVAMVVALSTKVVLEKKSNAIRPELFRTNALIFVTAGLGIWTGLSIPLFLGLKSSGFAVRTIMPAIGLLILIGVVALSMKNFVSSPSASTLQIQKTVSFESTTHIEEPTRGFQAQAFPPQNVTTRVAGVLPTISQPETGQAARGMGGLPVEGELFPPMRAQVAAPRVHHKKQMSDKAFNGGKVVISKPIVPAGTEPNTFDHIPTIDLATAAMMERERREMRPLPFSNIDAALDGALSTGEIMDKVQTSKRKPVPQSTSPKNSRNLLSVEEPSVAMTSAVQLSPAMEETRRRSPRQPYQGDGPSPSPPMIPAKDEARTPKSAPLQAATTVLVPPPRSIKRPPPIKPLQSRTTKDINALPAVSRFSVSTMDPMTARITSSMFSPQEQKSAKTVPLPRQTLPPPPPPVDGYWVDPRTASLPRSNSVKNNIRPSRRAPPSPTVEKEEVKETKTPLQRRATVGLPHNPRARATRMFTNQRSKSEDQQIMFFNNAESATLLVVPAPEEEVESPSRKSMIHRPRPIPRKSTASASELLGISALPTQDEFTIVSTPNLPLISPVSVKTLSQSSYGATSPGSVTRHKTVRRTSFVPDLPAVPVEYQGQQPKISEDVALDMAGASVWTVVPNDQGFQMPGSDNKTQRALCVSKFSVDTSLTIDEPRLSYNSRLSVNTQSSYEETIGRNSSVVFATDFKVTAVSTMVNSLSKRALKHESVDSEFSMMLRNAPVPPKTAPIENRVTEEGNRMVEAPFVLDMSKFESSGAYESEYQSTAQQMVSWHHRVGEELPSFSSQLKYRRNRKLLVPKPLALYRPANVTVVIEAEPSPVEPDQEALDRIHEQLKKFDTENGDSRATISEQQRMTILANLESEMGAQESQWQMLKVGLGPSSPSTIVSSPGINSLRSSVDISKFEMMPITKLNGSAGDLIVALKEEANHHLSKSSDQLLKEEAPEFREDIFNRQSLSASGRMSMISVTNLLSQIGSPTPPDTDESGEDSDNDSMVEGTGSTKDLSTVLMPRSHVSTVTSFLALDEVLNSPAEDVQSKLDVPVEFEDVSLITPKAQPPQPEEPKTESAKPAEPETIRFSLADLEQPAPRPRSVARRPPRQSRRISALPDIVENPEPLAGKTGSLGIFQFAWGEKSDSARVPPRMNGLSGTMSSGRGRMNPPTSMLLNSVQEAQANYPPAPAQSFLDDDEMDNGLDSYEDEDYDDGFDENTLWEIASLLESDLDGSRDDLFMVGEEEYWEDQVSATDDVPSATSPVESVKKEAYDFIPVTLASGNSSDVSQMPTLWTGDMKGQTTKVLGLPQSSEGAWEYYTAAPRSARAIPRTLEEPAQLSSSSLWMAASAGVFMYTSGLWASLTAHDGEEKETKSAKTSINAVKSLVWSLPSSRKVTGLGLPQPDTRLWNAYIPQETRSVRKTTQVPQPATIASRSLWALRPAVKPSMSNGVWSPANKSEAKLSTIAVAALWLPLSFVNGTTVGLSQPDASVWNSYITPAARTAYRTSRMSQPAVVASTSLWKAKSTIRPSASTGVWSPAPKETTIEVMSLATLAILPSLWSPISATRNGALGLPQPDIQAWNAYIEPESRVARRTSRQGQQLETQSAVMWSAEPLRTIELVSTKLWSLKKTTLLWAPTPFKGASIGLPQPDVKTWNTYIVLPARSIRHKANDCKCETIKSISLWQPSPAVVPYSGGVWKAKSLPVEPTLESRPNSSLKMVKDLLWSASSTKTPSVGLPQPDAMTWSMYLLPAGRSHRSAYVPRSVMITSTSLWAPTLPTESPSGGVWKPKSLPSKRQVAEPAVAVVRDLLWSSSPAKMTSLGLPQPDAKFWTAYLVPAGRSHRSAYIPRVITISSTSLWSHTPNVETRMDGVWKPKSKASATQKNSLWTLPLATKASIGLPQPDSKAWESYIPPMTHSTSHRILTSEPTSVESQSLWSLPPNKEAASGYLWRPSKTQAEKKRPTVQTAFAIRPAATSSPAAAESPVPAIAARPAGVRTSTPVLMTQEQWKLAFKRISQDVQKDSVAVAPSSSSSSNHASRARPTRLNRSQSVKSRPVFDPSVMALISELPSPRQALGRSKSISFLPPSRKPSSHGSSASDS
ncbi:uncharacterized protein Triagg1_7666 [Trichoderma aggressivum f. europaeum]|uniref:Uncharacterized protein n=1 Tax=Trichoderma aggressivum f. europaeum TaxID=173218 RepID=A0AAE1IBI9_9HYPO|nr:hypothetical protein Triagg1_7666 [Trichoderma aggressivum f. europaeum]